MVTQSPALVQALVLLLVLTNPSWISKNNRQLAVVFLKA